MQKQIYETHTWRDPYLDSDFYPVEMEQMIQVLSVPLIGIAISTLILICELMHKKWMIWKQEFIMFLITSTTNS